MRSVTLPRRVCVAVCHAFAPRLAGAICHASAPRTRRGLSRSSARAAAITAALTLFAGTSSAESNTLLDAAKNEREPLLRTLDDLVSIESGSSDREGLDRIAALIAGKLQALGGAVEMVEPSSEDIYRMSDTPKAPGKIVIARFTGSGTKKILLLAHMDTVYQRGMLAKQPFRLDGNRAYGLGIADDKQGIALILHALAMLQKTGFRDYALLTVMIDADEEVSSPTSRTLVTKLGREHDAVLSCEPSDATSDRLTLTTAGIAAAMLKVQGKASHAGSAPEQGRNALYELAHQVLQARDLSDPTLGVKVNWTLASAGTTRNTIPANAAATADVRVLRVADYDRVEQQLRERITHKLIPETTVELTFERRRPPLELKPAAEALARRAQAIYAEIGRTLEIKTMPEGGGTDAAFAALEARGPVLEWLGLQSFGSHTSEAEYVLLDSIEPRLYLLARLIMEVRALNQTNQ